MIDAIELKLELRDPALARAILRSLGAAHVRTVRQVDTHFHVPTGRLMRRVEDAAAPEFIRYDRADAAHPRASRCTSLTHAQASERFGAAALPERATVRKTRDVYAAGRIGVHVDRVENLGSFLEILAPLAPGDDESATHLEIHRLREGLAPALGEPVSSSYADMAAG